MISEVQHSSADIPAAFISTEGRAVGSRTCVNTGYGYRTSAASADLEPYSAPAAKDLQSLAAAGDGSWHPMAGLPPSVTDEGLQRPAG